ncbi:MBL fold metallo-hydrolase [Pyxidicoccus parkwayensis]|uniref:MBL fold metallo-hydrolase n=1 Tax=Pyxidicoccus parkwayensis TaxID=2813578 RepID=A0ABX7NQU6_9BACT|nr:MBL fold metallo-hydrolase [Pyxidicoccus parkwaysis]QSQ21239.1 MBL fold metallo-hydrolase [Pyxidicoccus parkwaysis]
MLFRQLFDAETSTYTYLLADETTREAALIDPVLEQVERDSKLLEELGLKLVLVLETHVHADHVTGAGMLRERTGATVAASPRGAPCVNRKVAHGDVLRLGRLEVKVLETPGHTDDSLSYLCEGRLFTGDTLLIRATGRTDFQNGDAGQLYDSITGRLFTLPDDTVVYPGHDYAGHALSTIGEEKRHNPRLAGRTREDFVTFMKSRQLPPPKKLDVAVPANRACGVIAPQPQA